jgi:hypothetical protein
MTVAETMEAGKWLYFVIAGFYYSSNLAKSVAKQLVRDEALSLVRETENPHDCNAIKVYAKKAHPIGYVPRNIAKELAPLMDSKVNLICTFVDCLAEQGDPKLRIRAHPLQDLPPEHPWIDRFNKIIV